MQSNNARLAERALPAEFGDENQLMNAVVRAHMETCDFIREKVRNQMADAQRQPDYTVCPPTLVSCISAAEFSSFFFLRTLLPQHDLDKNAGDDNLGC